MTDFLHSGYTFQWKIKNFSYCWLKKGEEIESPSFEANTLQFTQWSLVLYPRGSVAENYVGVYLRRENDDRGPLIIDVSFQFAILDKNGSFLTYKIGSKRGFAVGSVSGIGDFVTREQIFGSERDTFLPKDSLTIQCTVWNKHVMPGVKERAIHKTSAKTIFKINRRSFFWTINRCNFRTSNLRNHFVVKNESQDVLISFDLVLSAEPGYAGDIILEIISRHESLNFFSFDASVIDSEGRKMHSSSLKMIPSDFQKALLLSREQLMQNMTDVITLACEYVFSTGTILHVSEDSNFGIISDTVNVKDRNKLDIQQKKPLQRQTLVDDFKTMYSNTIFCDAELRTSTQTFPVHRNILSARSPVFLRMFSNDMRESISRYVDIIDLEDDTLRRMLLYMYTDVLEDLHFESASKLYAAADKYAILSLKSKCSCFLRDNMNPTTACDILTLAERHQDGDLKCAAQDYILKHAEVFVSQEWKHFMATNLQLAAELMYRKVSLPEKT